MYQNVSLSLMRAFSISEVTPIGTFSVYIETWPYLLLMQLNSNCACLLFFVTSRIFWWGSLRDNRYRWFNHCVFFVCFSINALLVSVSFQFVRLDAFQCNQLNELLSALSKISRFFLLFHQFGVSSPIKIFVIELIR